MHHKAIFMADLAEFRRAEQRSRLTYEITRLAASRPESLLSILLKGKSCKRQQVKVNAPPVARITQT
jgi:hypothetical protein